MRRRRRNPDYGEIPYGVAVPAESVTFHHDGTVTVETAGEPPVINRGRRRNQYFDPDTTRERMLRELSSDLADAVERGEMTDHEANEWYNRKADQWAMGLNPGRRRRNSAELDGSINLFEHPSLTGQTRRIPAGTPIQVIAKVRDRVLIEADYHGTPYHGWVDADYIRRT